MAMAAGARSYEDLQVGEILRGPGRTLTETDLVTFCMLTGDWHAIHADAEFAKGTKIGQRMFHGSFGIALAIGMSANLLTLRNPVIAALGLREWSFKAPLFINDTVHLELTITDKKVTSDGRRAVLGRKLRLCKHDRSTAQEGSADLMVALDVA
jgi:acyl dehydratase